MTIRSAGKLLLVGLAVMFASGCSEEGSNGGTGPSNSEKPWIGMWLIVRAGNQDISAMKQTMEITETTIIHTVPGFCVERWSYTVSGSSWASEVIQTNCLGGDPVGLKRSGTFTISGDRMTWNDTNEANPIVMERQ